MSARLSLALMSFSLLLSSVSALTCYENDSQGNTYERSNDRWKYCSLIPFAFSNGEGRLNGVGDTNEDISGYDATFGQNSKLYKVLTMCIQEKYDFAVINPAFGPAPEYMFRCFCNTDLCNREVTFSKFLSSLRH